MKAPQSSRVGNVYHVARLTEKMRGDNTPCLPPYKTVHVTGIHAVIVRFHINRHGNHAVVQNDVSSCYEGDGGDKNLIAILPPVDFLQGLQGNMKAAGAAIGNDTKATAVYTTKHPLVGLAVLPIGDTASFENIVYVLEGTVIGTKGANANVSHSNPPKIPMPLMV
jgi:hypothetical protein